MVPGRLRGLGRPVLRALGWPLRRALNPRVAWTVSEIDDRLGSEQNRRPAIHSRIDDLDSRSRELLRAVGELHLTTVGAQQGALEALPGDLAAFLNWVQGPEGYAAQANLWFNPPVPVEHRRGAVDPLLVNERIVELPFALRALANVAPPARLLDVGGSESTLALSLASLGYRVEVVDPRGYPLAHPNLEPHPCRLDQLPSDRRGFDAVVSLSAVEHFGLEHYGTPRSDSRLDLQALADLRSRLRPGGTLVLTVPFGEPSVDSFQRIYDRAGLDELLAGWELVSVDAAWRTERLCWQLGSLGRPLGDGGVALVHALNPARRRPARCQLT